MFEVFRVKNHDFTPKNHIFSNFRGARAGCAPSLNPPLGYHNLQCCLVMDLITKKILVPDSCRSDGKKR